jgi:hypothetical protein
MARHQRTKTLCPSFICVTAICLCMIGCGEEDRWPQLPDGGWTGKDLRLQFPDAPRYVDLGPVPDTLTDPNGPKIVITAPTEGEIVTDLIYKVVAEVTDPDEVDPSSVELTVQGRSPLSMSLGLAENTYEALIDLSKEQGGVRLWVTATDLKGRTNSAVRQFQRDPGPVVEFAAPLEGEYLKGSVQVKAFVTDPVGIDTFNVEVAGHKLDLKSKAVSASRKLFTGQLIFNDPFEPPLSGKQVLTATAINKHKAKTIAKRTINVDDMGPTIVIKSQKPGQIVGGTITLAAEVTDPAGVLASSVKCVIGKGDGSFTVSLIPSVNNAKLYEGQFDARALTSLDLWPIFSFRASDVLGNESHEDIQVGVDHGQPVIELDPQEQFFMARIKDAITECSHPFDPLGGDAANDNELVPQVVAIRARIEDQGNPVQSSKFVPISLVDETSVFLYVLDDITKPLVVDSTGDGYCDRISPEVAPLSSTVHAGKALAVKLEPVPPKGEPNFTPWADGWSTIFPFSVCNNGSEQKPPDPITFVSDLTTSIFYTADPSEAALWTIPPVVSGSKVMGLGLPFDFGANQVADGWVCVVVAARDNAGNQGVSPPIRLWVDKSASLGDKGNPPPGFAGALPSCTGTLDAKTGTVSTKACKFRSPPKVFPQKYPTTLRYIP